MGTKWEEGPSRFRLETPLGPIQLAATAATDFFVQTGSGDFPECLTVRGVDVYASVHICKNAAGAWEIASNPYIKRKGFYAYGKDHLPPTYEAKVKEAMVAAVAQYERENPDECCRVLLRAERGARNHRLISAEDQFKKAKEAYDAAAAELHEAQRRYNEAVAATDLEREKRIAADIAAGHGHGD